MGATPNQRIKQRLKRGSQHVKKKRRVKLVRKQKKICAICGELMQTTKPDDLDYATLDHIIPLGAGGENVIKNMQAAHKGCNEKKGSEIL